MKDMSTGPVPKMRIDSPSLRMNKGLIRIIGRLTGSRAEKKRRLLLIRKNRRKIGEITHTIKELDKVLSQLEEDPSRDPKVHKSLQEFFERRKKSEEEMLFEITYANSILKAPLLGLIPKYRLSCN